MKTALQWLDERGFHYKDKGVWESDIEAIQNDARAEIEAQLSAWHTSFGTSQLTHALAERESDKKRLEVAIDLLKETQTVYDADWYDRREVFLKSCKQ